MSLVIDGQLAVGCLDLSSVPRSCLLSHLAVALRAQSCGVNLVRSLERVSISRSVAFSLCSLLHDPSPGPFQAEMFLLHLKWG